MGNPWAVNLLIPAEFLIKKSPAANKINWNEYTNFSKHRLHCFRRSLKFLIATRRLYERVCPPAFCHQKTVSHPCICIIMSISQLFHPAISWQFILETSPWYFRDQVIDQDTYWFLAADTGCVQSEIVHKSTENWSLHEVHVQTMRLLVIFQQRFPNFFGKVESFMDCSFGKLRHISELTS